MPRRKIRSSELEVIKLMGGNGHNQTTIAARLKMSMRTWRRLLESCPRTAEAYTEARQAHLDSLVEALTKQCLDGDSGACKYLCNTMYGFRGYQAIPFESTPMGENAKLIENRESEEDLTRTEEWARMNDHQRTVAYRRQLGQDQANGQ